MVDVSVIIVNYNTYQVTQNCIDSIFKYTNDINFEIILVDNNSQDESYIEFTKDNRITYLYQSSNLGFGKANNIGFKFSKGKYIFLLNSDTLFKSNALKEFYEYMESSSKDIACVGTMLIDTNGNLMHSYGDFPTIWSGLCAHTILGNILLRLGATFEPQKYNNVVDYITGADLFIKKDIVLKYGLFDPDFFMYYEETELQHRYKKHGYKSVIYDRPKIVHLEKYSMKKFTQNKNLKKQLYLFSSYCIYLKKTTTTINYIIFRIIYTILSPFWLLHYKYGFKEKIQFIKATVLFSYNK